MYWNYSDRFEENILMKFTIYDKTSKKDVEQKKSFLGGLAIF